MIQLAALLWYCYDDWLAIQFDCPAVGDVHVLFWLLAVFIIGALSGD